MAAQHNVVEVAKLLPATHPVRFDVVLPQRLDVRRFGEPEGSAIIAESADPHASVQALQVDGCHATGDADEELHPQRLTVSHPGRCARYGINS